MINLVRFVPDETSFDADEVHDVYPPVDKVDATTSQLIDQSTYEPVSCINDPLHTHHMQVHHTTSALQMSRVQLSWDEQDPRRLKSLKDAFSKADATTNQNWR